MTSSNWKCLLAVLTLCLPLQASWASLGDAADSVESDRIRMRAHRSISRTVGYTVHELTTTDGSRIRQYVSPRGEVFAVSWVARHKPDLSTLLGKSSTEYAAAASHALRSSTMRHQLSYSGAEVDIHATEHLQVFKGYAVLRKQAPAGLTLFAAGN